MPDAAGVAGEVHSSRIVADTSETAFEGRELVFGDLRRFVDGDDVVFLPLIPERVGVAGEVAEPDGASVFEPEDALAGGVGDLSPDFSLEREDVVLSELREGAPDYETADSGPSETEPP